MKREKAKKTGRKTLTPLAEKRSLQNALLRDQLRLRRGELVEAAEIKPVIETALIALRANIQRIPDAAARDLGLSHVQHEALRKLVDAALGAYAAQLEKLAPPERSAKQ